MTYVLIFNKRSQSANRLPPSLCQSRDHPLLYILLSSLFLSFITGKQGLKPVRFTWQTLELTFAELGYVGESFCLITA